MSDFLMVALSDQEELYHYGIQGMHWGERRFQNPDGSLTEEGRRRYGASGTRKNLRSLESDVARTAYNKKMSEREYRKASDKASRIERRRELNEREREKLDKAASLQSRFQSDYAKTAATYEKAVQEAKNTFGDTKIKDVQYRLNGDIKARNEKEGTYLAVGLVTAMLASPIIGGAVAAVPAYKNAKAYNEMKDWYGREYDANTGTIDHIKYTS